MCNNGVCTINMSEFELMEAQIELEERFEKELELLQVDLWA